MFRLLPFAVGGGAWNMALDSVLLDRAAEHGEPCLRLYGWSEPTLTLGYFQRYSDRLQHAPSLNLPITRRDSGGGALVHDRELTYSLAAPSRFPWSRRPIDLYQLVHDSIVETFAELDVVARLCQLDASPPEGEPFLCFQRRAVGDVLIDEAKVVGSAQRRKRGAILQHGGILLGRSPAAPELPGLDELTLGEVSPFHQQKFIERWLVRLAQALDVEFEIRPATTAELNAADEMVRTKYAAPGWVQRL